MFVNRKPSLHNITKILTLEFIDDYLRDQKFESLGFLSSLVKECEKLYKYNNNDEWMKFYAENQENLNLLKYEPISLNELKSEKDSYNLLLDKYFIFVDEFKADSGVIMLRNFCRFLKIPCVLASTNSNIVNLVGSSFGTGSGSSHPSVFCALIPRLSTLSDKEIDQFFNEEINHDRFLELSRNISGNEERRMSLLLQFFKDQAKKSRPGVATYLFNAIKEVDESLSQLKTIKVDNIFKNVVESMINSIQFRKKRAFENIGGMYANIIMLGGNTFDPNYKFSRMSKTQFMDESSMIDDHFFYLKTPSIKLKEAEEPWLLFRRRSEKSLVFTNPKLRQELSIQCYFDENEELLKLVCLFAEMNYSSAGIIYSSLERKSLVLDRGMELEVVSFAAFLESSHYNERDSISLEGVGIKQFLKNLLKSFDKNSDGLRSWDIDLNYENVKDDQLLASSIVPCLYIVNHDWPAEIKTIFDPKESSYKLGRYTRTPNHSEIDATIDIIDKDGHNSLGVIECKNRHKPVDKTDYTTIINNAFKYSKIKKIENFLDNLRRILQPENIESFENFIKSDLRDPKFASLSENNRKSSESFIQNFEDSSKFQIVKNKLKDFIKEANLDEFDNLLKNLDNLNNTSPLFHFLICKSFSNLESLKKLCFPKRKINIFKFVKNGHREYEIIKTIEKIHDEPEMVAFIIETDAININKNE